MNLLRCKQCRTEKPISAFHESDHSKCKRCVRSNMRAALRREKQSTQNPFNPPTKGTRNV